ncbi:MAG: LbtU family siderophore porin [Alphaproteobacteria bacterium]|nr:LbtU family siderophore porin [Alphaproteobacteria bacterium]
MRLPGLLATAALIACLLPGSAWAQSGADARFEALERRIQQLEERLAERDAAMAEKEQALAKLQAKVAVQEQTAADIRAEVAESGAGGWTDGLEIGGAVEVLVSHDSPYEGNSTSNNETDTVEVALAAGIGDYASAELVLEKDDEDKVEVADAFFTIDSGAGVSFSAGKMGLPFADFETNLVSDPMALEIGEAVKNALMLSFESEAGFSASAYTFNGDADYNGRDRIDKVGAQAGFGTEIGGMGVELGVGWISDIREAEGFVEGEPPETAKKIDGLAVSGGLSFGPLSFLGHYMTTRDKVDGVDWTVADLTANESSVTYETQPVLTDPILDRSLLGDPIDDDLGSVGVAEPSAWGVEMGYAFEAGGREIGVALGYQRTHEALALEMPESRVLFGLSTELVEGIGIALEYARRNDYGTGSCAGWEVDLGEDEKIGGENGDADTWSAICGTGKSGSTVSLLLSAEF